MSANPLDDAVALLVGMCSVSVEIARLALEHSAGDANRAAIECLDNAVGLQAELDRRQTLERRRARFEAVHRRHDDGEDYDEDFESTFIINKCEPLPIPAGPAELALRNSRYEEARDLRRSTFAKRTHDGIFLCRQLYAEAYQLLGFACLHSADDIMASCPSYTTGIHVADGKKCVIVLRKIGECCYYLNRLAEGVFTCKRAIEVSQKFGLENIAWFAWGVLCKIHTETPTDFERASQALEMAHALKRGSAYLYKAKVNLGRAQRGLEVDDGPARLRAKFPDANWYEGDELAMERCRSLSGLVDVCERHRFGLSLLDSQKFPWLFVAWIQVGEVRLSCYWTSLVLW